MKKIVCCEVALQKEMSSAKALYETALIKSFGPNDPSKIYIKLLVITLFQYLFLTKIHLHHQT